MRTTFLPAILGVALGLQGCATIHRVPFDEAQQVDARVGGIAEARFWADAPDAARRMATSFTGTQGETTMLALSGGSDSGAYGAGLLNGWTRAGNRPQFAIVTGVSTGALIAPFAFLGPDQDATLERLYTTISARDIYRRKFPMSVFFSPSAVSVKPFSHLIASAVTDGLIDRIAAEAARGRRLFIGTANLDAQRMVIWNMGAIASSRAPGRYALFRQVLLASSSIPALFPPVMITAQASGKTISEMHVDGGTTAQILTLPDELLTGSVPPAKARPLHIYVIVNNKLNNEFHMVKPRALPIASRSFDLSMSSALGSTVDLSYLYAKAHGIDYNLAYISKDYPGEGHKMFDNAYMRGLFDHGLHVGEHGDFWEKRPPGWNE